MFARDPLANPEPLIKRVYAYVAYRIGDGPEAEDVTSETFERALRYRSSFDPRRGEPVAWLIGIARRCADEALSGRTHHLAETEDLAAAGDLEGETVRRLELAAAVATLEERDRELIALRYGADLTARQIAELQGLKTNAVEVALHRALRRLRQQLEPEAGGGSGATTPALNPVRI
jgi:RNA polymerase sigma-70 factor (ECF subfamily)